MGFFDDLLPQIATAGANLGAKGKKPTGVSQQPLPITPTLPQGAYNRTPSTAGGPTTAQIFAPLINRMAGGANQSPMNRKTMDGTGTGLSTNESWNGMFSHGAKDLSPEQLRASQGSTAMNQWQDPQHYHGSMPSDMTNAEGADQASPQSTNMSKVLAHLGQNPDHHGQQQVQLQMPGMWKHGQAEQLGMNPGAIAADNMRFYTGQGGKSVVGQNQSPTGISSAPHAEPLKHPLGSPQPGFNFGVGMINGGLLGASDALPTPGLMGDFPTQLDHADKAEMFGPSILQMAWPPTSPRQKLRQNVAKAADIRANQVTQPDWGAAPMF